MRDVRVWLRRRLICHFGLWSCATPEGSAASRMVLSAGLDDAHPGRDHHFLMHLESRLDHQGSLSPIPTNPKAWRKPPTPMRRVPPRLSPVNRIRGVQFCGSAIYRLQQFRICEDHCSSNWAKGWLCATPGACAEVQDTQVWSNRPNWDWLCRPSDQSSGREFTCSFISSRFSASLPPCSCPAIRLWVFTVHRTCGRYCITAGVSLGLQILSKLLLHQRLRYEISFCRYWFMQRLGRVFSAPLCFMTCRFVKLPCFGEQVSDLSHVDVVADLAWGCRGHGGFVHIAEEEKKANSSIK